MKPARQIPQSGPRPSAGATLMKVTGPVNGLLYSGSMHREPQSAGAVLMVRPACFAFNAETAASNVFQKAPADAPTHIAAAALQTSALREFDDVASGLQRAGVEVLVAEDTESPLKPDAVFPNNWVSFHHDGTVVLYPMLAPNRRLERRDEVLRRVTWDGGFQTTRVVDLSAHEQHAEYLEGTGSLVLDRVNRMAYASLSPRTHLAALGEFSQRLDYHLTTFAATAAATPIYHTNVLMAIGAHFAVICGAAIADPAQRSAVFDRLRASGHELIEISPRQMEQFAGNVLELAPSTGSVIALSRSAWLSFDSAQRSRLERHGAVLPLDIPVIQTVGGGGIRCMLAEIHLPRRS